MDEFLVSGETIVRDLQLGLERAAAFGGAMPVGYLPDMFGHVAQMPQLLRQAGFEHAVVWRGVPSAVTATAFWWEAPDGSSVRAEYLPVGYGAGSSLPDDAKALIERVRDLESEVSTFLLDRLLVMNGSDHLAPQPRLGAVVAEANALQDDYQLAITSLPEYLAEAPVEGLGRWVGELRSGARANVLMGVTSNRVDVKQAAAAAERSLEHRAEPLAALVLAPEHYPDRLLALAWREVVRNAAHDSVCACSVDEVVDAVVHRYAEARQIGDGVAERGLRALGGSMAGPGPVVVNLAGRSRGGLVELVVAADGPPGPDLQVISERTGLPGTLTIDANTARTVLAMLQGSRIDDDAWVHDVAVDEDETGIDVTVTIGPDERPGVPIARAKQDLYVRLGARPDAMVRVRLDQPPIRRVVARVAPVPGLGWSAFAAATLAHPVQATDGPDGVTLSNGLVTVVVDPASGTFSVDQVPGFGRLVDQGDLGDSYNYSPPVSDTVVERPEAVSVRTDRTGPVRASAVITATYRWPDHVDGTSQRRVGEHVVEVTTSVEVQADEPTVRVATTFVNPSRDHRLRVHLPLPAPAAGSEAGCAFGPVRRGLAVEGRPDEHGLPTFPARGFVRAGGLTVVPDAVREYELVDVSDTGEGPRAASLALTVLRSTGMLSRLGMTYRPFPAGPLTPVDGLQLVGRPVTCRYALALGDVDPYALADSVLNPLEVVDSLGGGHRPATGQLLAVEGAELSSVRRRAGVVEIRVFNPSDQPTTVRCGERSGWLVDLRGRTTGAFDGSFELRARGIATFRLPGI
jgi:hypothetical protein